MKNRRLENIIDLLIEQSYEQQLCKNEFIKESKIYAEYLQDDMNSYVWKNYELYEI